MNDNLTYSYRPGTDLDTLITNSAGVGAAYTYDWSGNITSNSRDSVGFILYDIYNQPVEVFDKNGTVIQYGYDANGARVEKEIGSSYNCYIRGKDGHTDVILLDLSSDNDIFNTIANGDNIGQVDWTNQLFSHYYYIKDHLGDVRMIMDENGNPQVWNNYYPFGEEMPGLNIVNSGPDDRYGFTSKELDAETGLYYFGARYYDSWNGRWLSVDPLSKKYPGWSPYNYVRDNPTGLVDPNGAQVKPKRLIKRQGAPISPIMHGSLKLSHSLSGGSEANATGGKPNLAAKAEKAVVVLGYAHEGVDITVDQYATKDVATEFASHSMYIGLGLLFVNSALTFGNSNESLALKGIKTANDAIGTFGELPGFAFSVLTNAAISHDEAAYKYDLTHFSTGSNVTSVSLPLP